MLGKYIAKKIIILPPFSMTRMGVFLKSFGMSMRSADAFLQGWALGRADSFSEKDWQEVQLGKLKRILTHANKNVQYWGDLFRNIGFKPGKMRTLGEISMIPISTRAALKAMTVSDLSAKNIPQRRFVDASTSGSTGEPFRFYQDEAELFRREINTRQELRYAGVDPDSAIMLLGMRAHRDLNDLGPYFDIRSIEDEEYRQHFYPFFGSRRPKLVISSPSYLERFLYFCKKDGFRPIIEKVCYMGEGMGRELSHEIETFFGSNIYTVYGTRECSLLGIQCEHGTIHLAPWMNLVEIIDEQIVVTTFNNEAMPFIRYAIGDLGKISFVPCQCGRRSGRLEFHGRLAAGAFEFSDGSARQMSFAMNAVSREFFAHIKKFQFQQISLNALCVCYIPMDMSISCKDLEKKIEECLLKIFPKDVEILFKRVESISPNEAGKTPLFVKSIKA